MIFATDIDLIFRISLRLFVHFQDAKHFLSTTRSNCAISDDLLIRNSIQLYWSIKVGSNGHSDKLKEIKDQTVQQNVHIFPLIVVLISFSNIQTLGRICCIITKTIRTFEWPMKVNKICYIFEIGCLFLSVSSQRWGAVLQMHEKKCEETVRWNWMILTL